MCSAGPSARDIESHAIGKDIVPMCRYAEQDQPRPRRCFYLEDPCDECAAEEQAKMDELGEEHMKCQMTSVEPTLPESKGTDPDETF